MFNFDEKILNDGDIVKVKTLDTINNGDVDETKERIIDELKNDPQNMNLRFKLAKLHLSSSETEEGFNELLKIFEQDPNGMKRQKKIIRIF